MNTTEPTSSTHWTKALIASLLLFFVLFLLFSRSSCSRSLEKAKAATATTSESNEDSSESADSESESAAKNKSPSEENAESTDNTESEPDKNTPTPDPTSKGDSDPAKEAPLTSPPAPDSLDPATKETAPTAGGGRSGAASSGETSGQNIGGLSVKGDRLGVILDVSGSMTRYLDDLRREIQAGFSSAVFLEVEGCLLEPVDQTALDDTIGISRSSVMNAIFELAQAHQVDSIYWFCDLQDERTDKALEELQSLASGQSTASNGFRLYIRSTDEKPDTVLEEIVRRSGGAFERRR